MNRHRARRRAPLAVVLLLVHAACYSYVPLQPAPGGASASATSGAPESAASQLGLVDLKQGASLRVHLSEPGSYPLTALTPNNVTVIDGDLIRFDEDNLYVSAYWMKTAGVQEFKGEGETVTIQLDQVDRIDQKKVSAGKTAALAAVIAGAIVAIGVTFGSGSGEGGDNGGGVQPD
ncbi:MAG: hypothetical protein JSV95_00955 [Gemmatimonadota bacterium]|nr:MAG: hypothetical protein JSV95_00955 [Gemmatimonadota bacterium]